jgi:otoferlin
VIAERQHAKYIIKIYRADGLPRNKSGLVANVKKAIAGDYAKQLVSPYVQVSFAGLSGKTSIKRNCCTPVWNEQVIITEMFPPLCQRVKIQIRDSDPVSDNVIATHFIQLSKISNEGAKGFLPTFGPSFIYLYGSSRDCSIFDDQSILNDGFSEGIMYRGRILIAIKTEILESLDAYLCGVNVEPTSSINEVIMCF